MRPRVPSLLRYLPVFLLGAFALVAGSTSVPGEETVTITGEIEAADYDDSGEVTSVSIYDGEWGSVLVAKEGRGAELLKHVGDVVKVTGRIEDLDDDSGFYYVIRVASFTVEQTSGRQEPEDEGTWETEDEE